MQTFLPFPLDFEASARCLDNRRLGKQRVECLQILQTIKKIQNTTPDKRKTIPWANHPAIKMWEHYAFDLQCYAAAICVEWTNRGFKDTVRDKVRNIVFTGVYYAPYWLAEIALARSHQSNLLRKAHEDIKKAKSITQLKLATYNLHRYEQAFLQDPNNNGALPPLDLPYVWPCQ